MTKEDTIAAFERYDQPEPTTAIATLRADVESTPTPIADETIAFVKGFGKRLVVKTADDAVRLTEGLKRIVELRKSCEAQKKRITTPLSQISRAWGARWNPALKALEEVERRAKRIVLDFQEEQAREAKSRLEGATTPEEVSAIVTATTTRPMGSRKVWRFQVMDPRALPDQYRIPDQDALDALAREHGEALRIPGGFAVCDTIPVMPRSK